MRKAGPLIKSLLNGFAAALNTNMSIGISMITPSNCTRDYPGIFIFTTKPDPTGGLPMKHRGPFMQQLETVVFYFNKRQYLS
jgi:hypothetical protein